MVSSDFLNLIEFELDRRLAPEDRDKRTHFFLLRLNLVDEPGEVEERSRCNLDAIAFLEVDLELGRFDAHLLENRLDFFVLQRHRFFARARTSDETRHA